MATSSHKSVCTQCMPNRVNSQKTFQSWLRLNIAQTCEIVDWSIAAHCQKYRIILLLQAQCEGFAPEASLSCSLQKERVSVGDVIYIEANSGAVKRVGRCDAYATEFDLEAEEYVPLPKVCPLFLCYAVFAVCCTSADATSVNKAKIAPEGPDACDLITMCWP